MRSTASLAVVESNFGTCLALRRSISISGSSITIRCFGSSAPSALCIARIVLRSLSRSVVSPPVSQRHTSRSQSGALSMVVSMAGTAAVVTLTGDNMVLRMTVGLNGTGAFQLTGTNNLALIVPFEGIGSVVTMGVGSTDLRELLSLSGEWTPFTELSPEGLANAVWSSLVSQYQDDGTMGKALSTASSGGVDLGALAAAVWTYATRNMPAAERDAAAAAVIAAAQATPIDANIKEVNDTTIDGAGTAGDPWGPA